jgi:hypothetical protein
MYQLYYVKIFSTDQNNNLLLLDDPGRVRSQITTVSTPGQMHSVKVPKPFRMKTKIAISALKNIV